MAVIDVVKSIFRSLSNKKYDMKRPPPNKRKTIVENVLSIVFSDPKLSEPSYISGLSNEKQTEMFGNTFPLQYIWNEYLTSEGRLGYSFSINGSVIGYILERFIPRHDPNFNNIRDEIIHLMHSMGKEVTQKIIIAAQARPSQSYKQYDFLVLAESHHLTSNIIGYDGGFVTRELVEEAIDFMISLEPIDSGAPDADEEYKSNTELYWNEIIKAKQIFKKFAEQITPLTLENMQKIFYSITKSEKYYSSAIYHSVAYSCLESSWNNVGPWRS